MKNLFFDKVCTISKTVYQITWWEEIKTTSNLYIWIKCDFYRSTQQNYYNSEMEKESQNTSYTIVIEADKTLVRKWYTVSVTDKIWQDYWSYIISDVQVFRNLKWLIDNIQLTVKQIL
jgi:hypothetical protein